MIGWLFLVCLGVRAALAYAVHSVAASTNRMRQVVLAALFVALAIGTLVADYRGRDTGSFGQRAWWGPYRTVHAVLWLGIAACLWKRKHDAAVVLAVADVAISAAAKARRELMLASSRVPGNEN